MDVAGGLDSCADVGGGFAGGGGAEFLVFDGGDVDVEVDAVEEGAGEAGVVALDLGRGAAAFAGGVGEVAAGAGVERADKEVACGELAGHGGAGDGDDAVFEGLAEGFEGAAGEFGHFVEVEDAVVGE